MEEQIPIIDTSSLKIPDFLNFYQDPWIILLEIEENVEKRLISQC